MAKYDEREGNSCHIHISFRGDDGSAVFADDDQPRGMSKMFRSFIAGQLATLRELTLFYAPNINSYKRFVDGSFAPTAVAWGMDNRTCALRVVGHGHGMRMECRAPGGDVNQYLAVAALIAGGLHGIEQELELPEPVRGQRVYRWRGTASDHPGRGGGAVRALDGGPGGVRRRGRRALPEQCAGRTERVQLGGDRLGEAPWFRTSLRSQRRPVLGLTTYLQQAQTGVWDVTASFLPAIYIEGVTMAGGIATLLPPQPVDDDIADRVLDGLDGLVITGGRDVDPATYGQAPHPTTDEPASDRDAWEFALLERALERGLPVLGICRGAQVLNVALGGTLHQHLPDVVGHNWHQAGNAVFNTSVIRTVPGTRVAALIGESTDAQCYHHQAIAELGRGLDRHAPGIPTASSKPSRCPGTTFVVAVQWHPEERLDDLRLFAGVVEAAAARMRTEREPRDATSTLINPATEEVLRTVEQLDVAAVDDAVARAKSAQKQWAKLRARRAGRRAACVRRRWSMPTSTNSPRSRWRTPGT